MKVYAECNITINPGMNAKSTRRVPGEVNMDIFSSQGVNAPKPITLVIKGADVEQFSHILKLTQILGKPDEELAEKARSSPLAGMVKDMTVEETASWFRDSIIEELKDMEGSNEDPLV